MTLPWGNPDADPLADMRAALARAREESGTYVPDVYWMSQADWDRCVLAGLITTDNPMWRPYPTIEELR